jgi:uncharacterized protein (TIGR03435 family)
MPKVLAGTIFAVFVGCLLAPASAISQAAPVKTPIFDVVSIRRNVAGTGSCGPQQMQPTPVGFHMTNCPLILALVAAYAPKDGPDLGFALNDRLIGMPDWLTSERYDIDARIAEADLDQWHKPEVQKEMLRTMLQSLLSDRCKLAVHREMKDKSVYELIVGKSGPKLKLAESTDAEAIRVKHPGAVAIPGSTGMFAPGPTPGSVALFGGSMDTLALLLSQPAGRPVVNKTGLTGRYDVELEMGRPSPAAQGESDTESIFSIVQYRLGLKLESQKNEVEVLVIDHMERPSQN